MFNNQFVLVACNNSIRESSKSATTYLHHDGNDEKVCNHRSRLRGGGIKWKASAELLVPSKAIGDGTMGMHKVEWLLRRTEGLVNTCWACFECMRFLREKQAGSTLCLPSTTHWLGVGGRLVHSLIARTTTLYLQRRIIFVSSYPRKETHCWGWKTASPLRQKKKSAAVPRRDPAQRGNWLDLHCGEAFLTDKSVSLSLS